MSLISLSTYKRTILSRDSYPRLWDGNPENRKLNLLTCSNVSLTRWRRIVPPLWLQKLIDLIKVECLRSTYSSAHSAWRQVTMKPICETHVSMIITVCSEVHFYQSTTSEDITSTWETTVTQSHFRSRRQIWGEWYTQEMMWAVWCTFLHRTRLITQLYHSSNSVDKVIFSKLTAVWLIIKFHF